MTAPAKSRRRAEAVARTRTHAARATAVELEPLTVEPEATPARRNSRSRTTAAERAYARRAQRAGLLQQREPEPEAVEAPVEKRRKIHWPRSRASFVLLVMGLLAAGVATTLWLTTQAIADSYRLEQLRTANQNLAETRERLLHDVTNAESPASLAPAAKALGMVPSGDPARIIVGADGGHRLVGEPQKAKGDAPVTQPAPPPVPPAAGTQSQQGAPIEGDQPAVPAQEGQRQ